MILREILKKVENSDEYKQWKDNNKYLVHFFIMLEDKAEIDQLNNKEWQVGYYDKTNDMITVFNCGEKITINPESEVFKSETTILPLDLKKISLSPREAVKEALTLAETVYNHKDISQIIILLQHLPIGQIWNITLVTKSYEIINIRINTSTTDVISHSCEPIFKLGKFES